MGVVKLLAFFLLVMPTILILSVCVIWILAFTGFDYAGRYSSWRALSPTHIAETAQSYIDNRARPVGDITAICIYAVDCLGDRARLTIIPNVENYDFEALRDRIWARRFDGVCTGQTANLGLSVVRSSDVNAVRHSDLAVWSFYSNGFIPMGSRGSGASFSLEPWERCSLDRATYLVRDGVLLNPAE